MIVERRRKVLFSGIAMLLALGTLEVSARVARRWRESPMVVSRDHRPTQRDPVLHHRWKPSLRFYDQARETPYWLITNAQSWVEPQDVQRPKPAGTYRIFYVGDSNTQGVVPADRSMVHLVETELNQRCGTPGLTLEVINAGTSSYSFILYYLQIKNQLLAYQPDLVVINVDMTDVVNDWVYRRTAVRDVHGDIVAVLPSVQLDTARYRMGPQGVVELAVTAPMHHWLVNHSALCYYLDRALARLRGTARVDVQVNGIGDARVNWLAQQWSTEIEANVNESMDMLVQTLRLLQHAGVKAMVTGVPHYPQYTGEWSSRPHEVLQRTTEAAGAQFLNSYALLRPDIEGSAVGDYYWPSDPTHFNASGNRLWAAAQVTFLTNPRHQLLPEDSACSGD